MVESSTLKNFVFIVLVAYLAQQLPGTRAGMFGYKFPWEKTSKGPDSRTFVKAKGKELEVLPGDTVVSYIKPNKWFIYRPLRWHYAISSEELVFFIPTSIKKAFSSTKARMVNIKSGKYKDYKLQNRQKKQGHIGDVGVLVGYLMTRYNDKLPYDAIRCSGKHYVEYLSKGSANGNYKKVLYWLAADKCPVFNPLRAEMFDSIYLDKKFTLVDRNQPARSYYLSTDDWPQSIKDLKARRDAIVAQRELQKAASRSTT